MMTEPLYVIVHHRVRPHVTTDTVWDIDPDDNLTRICKQAAELQDNIDRKNAVVDRRNDTFRVAELRYVDGQP